MRCFTPFGPHVGRGVAIALACWALASCQVEINRRDHWAEKAGSFQQLQGDQPRVASSAESDTEPTKLRIENPDGSVTLNSFLPEHLVGHLRSCIAMGESDLIYDQLLSGAAKQAYAEKTLDAHEAVDWLMDNQRDVLIMLNRMTGGLSSPDVSWQSMGNTYRMQIVSPIRSSLRFTTLDLITEDGQFKLLLIS